MQLKRYRKVSCQIWLDEKFLSMPDDAKLVFLLILTHPNMTSFGAMKTSPASLTDELGWPIERLSKAFQEVLTKGFGHYNDKVRLLVLTNFIKHNKPESPNVIKSWAQGYTHLPECDLKTQLYHTLKDFAKGLSKAFEKAFLDSFGIQRTENSDIKIPSTKGDVPPPQKENDPIWHNGLSFLIRKGIQEKQARSFLGKLRQKAGDVVLIAALSECESSDISDPIAWLSKVAVSNQAKQNQVKDKSPADRVMRLYGESQQNQFLELSHE